MQTPSFLRKFGAAGIALSAAAVMLLVAALCVGIVVGASNRYNALVVRAAAKQTDNRNVLDNTRKKLREVNGVGQQEVAALEKIIIGNAEARSAGAGAGQLATLVTEAVPQVTEIKSLNRLIDIIAAARTDWQTSQTELIEIKRQGDHMMSQFPDSLVLGILGKQPIQIVVITSAETEENFRTGEDNDTWIPAPDATTKPLEK